MLGSRDNVRFISPHRSRDNSRVIPGKILKGDFSRVDL